MVKSQGVGGTQKSFIRLFTSFIPAGIRPQIKYCLLSFVYVEARPRLVQSLTPFAHNFDRKDIPYVYLFLTNGTQFTYLVYNFPSL